VGLTMRFTRLDTPSRPSGRLPPPPRMMLSTAAMVAAAAAAAADVDAAPSPFLPSASSPSSSGESS
jgi:hypothetical protein